MSDLFFRAEDKDTICALSTPPGTGGIAVIRISGLKSAELVRKLCRFLPEKPESHRVYYGFLKSLNNDESIDEVLATYFADGRSFTGEETVEVSCHGGPIIAGSILKELVATGCRMAKRGEFTYRAFMNGRLDLVQAESILGLIESQSKPSAKVALRQLTGHLSQDFARIEDDLVWILAHLEASIDFSTEGIEVVDHGVLLSRVTALQTHVTKLISTYNRGKMLREGIEVALVGRPNAGKSSLLNAFLKEDRAIVTPIAGTTRDTIEGQMTIAGLPVTLVDTAGLRETENEIEKIGIERSRSAMIRADFVFHVVDTSSDDLETQISEYSKAGGENTYLLLNKIDLDISGKKRSEIGGVLSKFEVFLDRVFWISAIKSEGLEALEEKMASLVGTVDSDSSNVITQARHLELLQKIQSCLATAHRLISDASSPEFIAFELQESVRAIHELLGKEFDEQVIDRIFKEFCLGK